MKILAIETSCDETAVAVVEGVDEDLKILSNVVVSQVDIFAAYGGVIPEVAARSHLEAMMPVLDEAMKGISWDEIDAIAVTHTPGLLGSLLIGTLTARQLAILHNKPLYAVHHLKSHIYANWVGMGVKEGETSVAARPSDSSSQAALAKSLRSEKRIATNFSPLFPLLALVISGGHTQILYMREHNQFEIVGTTRDDAVGECFDKVAKILGLPYPGGPSIAKVAENGDAFKYKLPHPQVEGLDFSFSGLKTAVLRVVQKELGLPISHPSHDLKNHLNEQQVADFAASFQRTAVDILAEKMEMALKKFPEVKSIVVSGGVSANEELRKVFREKFGDMVYFPEPKFAGDNAVMVGVAAYYEILSGVKPVNPYHLDIMPRSEIK